MAHLGWRAAFWVNVPIAVVIAVLAVAVRTPAPERAVSSRLDLTGAGLLAVALALLVHALAGVPARGWVSAPTLLELLAFTVVVTALAWHERHTAHPIVPPAVARSAPVMASMALLLVISGGLFGVLFMGTFFLQDTLHLDPFASGVRVLPLTALMILGAPVASVALRRHGARRTAVAGTALVVLGIVGLSRVGPDSPWTGLPAALAVIGAGYATVMVTATGTVVGDAPPGYAGVVGGLKQTAMNIGPTLGIAVAAGAAGSAVAMMGPALLVLAALAAIGLLPASQLPGRPARREGPVTKAHREGPAAKAGTSTEPADLRGSAER